jgi:hypothetical protein
MIHIHTCIESTSTTFTLLYPLHLPSPSCYYPLLNMTCFTFIVEVPVHCTMGVCLGILPVNMLYRNQSNPFCYSSPPFSPYSVLFNSFQCISLCLVPTQMWYISILSTICHSSYPPPSVSFNSLTFGNISHIYIHIYDNAHVCIWICLSLMRENIWPLLRINFWS